MSKPLWSDDLVEKDFINSPDYCTIGNLMDDIACLKEDISKYKARMQILYNFIKESDDYVYLSIECVNWFDKEGVPK